MLGTLGRIKSKDVDIRDSIGIIVNYSIPFVLIKALDINTSINLVSTITASAYVFIMGCYVPIPGATGGMEYGFSGFFGNFIKGYQINALFKLLFMLKYKIYIVNFWIII